MQEYVDAMRSGWNLGNTYDAIPNETAWGNPTPTRELIQQVAAQGFTSIRIPVTWSPHVGPAPDYTIDPAWLAKIQQVVGWSLQAGLHVMINMHHDSWMWVGSMPTNHDAVLAEYSAIWTQIAAGFAEYPRRLMFESINEPSFNNVPDATAMSLLDELNTAFVNIVRSSGGENARRPLVLPPLHTGGGASWLDSLSNTVTKLTDPNLIVTVHYYGFWPFSVNIANFTTFDSTSSNDVAAVDDAVYNTFGTKGIPCIIGEYGVFAWDSDPDAIERGEMLKFFDYFTYYARSKHDAYMMWDNGGRFNRTTYRWKDPDFYALIKHSVAGRSSTANTDLIFLKNGTTPQDTALQVNTNGNRFVSLEDGSGRLHQGSEYTYDPNSTTLTVTAGELSEYTSGSYGEKATLLADFNSGPAWKVHVRYINTPVLSASSGTTGAGLVIPSSFNGDLLATMESVYAGGGNAGPASWTSYQQFGYAFTPDYVNNTLTLPAVFFAGGNGGTINLTLHFWSGQIVKYQLVVSGTGVTGSPL